MANNKIVIIGAGIGGLASAALLGKKGYDVTILEKNSKIGGRAMSYEKNGFRFDMGPSWYHMPEVFRTYFSHFGKKPEDFYKLIKLDPQYRIFFADDSSITIERNLDNNLKTFETLEPGVSQHIRNYLNIGKHEYETIRDYVLYRNIDSIKSILNPEIRKKITSLRVLQSLESLVKQYAKSTKMQQILLHQGLFIGLDPKKSRAFMSLFTHLDLSIGVEYPLGGIYSFIQALEILCKKNNVKIQPDTEVQQLIVQQHRVKTLITSRGEYEADIVLSNADYPYTEMKLLTPEYQSYAESYWQKKTFAPSAFIIFLGIKGLLPQFLHHNYYFPLNWNRHFETIAHASGLPYDPLIYFSCSSKTDRSLAPPNHENLFISAAIPVGLQISDEEKKLYAKHLIRKVEGATGAEFMNRISLEKIFTGDDFKSTFNAYKGTALGLSQTIEQSMILRPKQKSKKVNNLFYVGQYTNPGIGMPMCLISAELVVNHICNEQ